MNKKTLQGLIDEGIDFTSQKVFLRVDYNVPLVKNNDNNEMEISDDTRIRATIKTIKLLLNTQCKIIICSHLGRPKGEIKEDLRLLPVANRLRELLNENNEINVIYLNETIGDNVIHTINEMSNGSIVLLENVRFHPGETNGDVELAEALGNLADIYINDAFGAAHRAHSSTSIITNYVNTSVAGLLMERELKYLDLENCDHPLLAIIGGSKVSSKIPIITSLIEKCDALILGGGLVFTFFKALGKNVGNSLVEDDMVDLARELLTKAEEQNVRIILPIDIAAADDFNNNANKQIVTMDDTGVPDNWMGLDIGPASIELFRQEISTFRTIVWNGPMGVFEMEIFSAGSFAICDILKNVTTEGAVSIIGGGDSVSCISVANYEFSDFTFVSTGGGASLELLGGATLPGVAALNDN